MLVSDITRKVQRLFGDSSFVVINQQDIYDWINEAQLLIVRKTDCLTGTTTAAASTFPANLPADWVKTKRVVYGTTQVLNPIMIEDLDQYNIDPSYNDTPDFYYIWNNQLNLFPDPNSSDATTVSHYYVKLPATISSTGATPAVPVSYHEDLVRFCLMRAYERNEDNNRMQLSSQIFESTSGNRLDESKIPDDDFFVVRDDPVETEIYGSVW